MSQRLTHLSMPIAPPPHLISSRLTLPHLISSPQTALGSAQQIEYDPRALLHALVLLVLRLDRRREVLHEALLGGQWRLRVREGGGEEREGADARGAEEVEEGGEGCVQG